MRPQWRLCLSCFSIIKNMQKSAVPGRRSLIYLRLELRIQFFRAVKNTVRGDGVLLLNEYVFISGSQVRPPPLWR